MVGIADAIEQAFIEVIADTSRFDEELRRDVVRSLDRVRREGVRAFLGIERSAQSAGLEIAGLIGNMRDRFQQGTLTVERLAATIKRLEDDFNQLGGEGVRELDRLRDTVRQLDNAIIAGPIQSLERTGDAAERFGQRIRASLGRAAVAGVEQLEDSFRDLRRTGERESLILSDRIEAALNGLGDVPGLERLRRQFRELSSRVQDQFGGALDTAEAKLRELADRGELTEDQLRGAIIGVSRLLDQQLGEALDEVNTELRLLGGKDDVFRELARDIERAQQEQADYNAELLQTNERLERVTSEARQAGAATRRFGREASRSARRGTDAMGTFIARMNRVRFLALDLRFVLSGIGIFAAAQFARMGLEATSELEQVRLSFQVIGRNIEGDLGDSIDSFRGQAVGALDEVIEFARETPFAIGEVAEAVRRLSAFLPSFRLFEPEEIDTLNERTAVSLDLFQDMGGALAVLGQQDAMPRLVKALGDVAARGKLTGEEMRQFANAIPGIEIREAIITGIFDPSVRVSESIAHLREEFTKLGADATQAPQEALNAFVLFQRQGLITTDAVLQGLLTSFRNLAGEDAIQAFTLTLAGSMEKLRESIEVGMFRGLEPLGQVLVNQLLPALEDVEDASERFGESFADLAATALPVLLDGFEVLTVVAADFFDQMSRFIATNGPEIDRFFETGAALADTFFEALFALGEAVFPLVPVFFELADVGLGALVPVLEALTPLIETLAEGLEVIPPEVLAVTLAFTQFRRVLLGFDTIVNRAGRAVGLLGDRTLIAGRHIAAMPAIAGAAKGALIGLFAGAALIGRFNRNMEEGRQAVADLREELTTLEGDADFSVFFEDIANNAERGWQEIERLHEAAGEGLAGGGGLADSIFQALPFGLADLGDEIRTTLLGAFGETGKAIAGAKDLTQAMGEIQAAARELELRGIPGIRHSLLLLNSGFETSALSTTLTEDALGRLLSSLDFTNDEILALISQGFGPFNEAVLTAIDRAGGLDQALFDAGIAAGDFNLDKLAEEGATVEEVFLAAAGAVQELTDTILASLDPNFAAIRARQDVADAEQAVQDILESTDFETEAERRRALELAYLDVAEAVSKEAAAEAELIGILAETGRGLDDNEEALGRLLQIYVDNPNIGQGALDAFIAENDITIERLRALARQFPELSGDINKFIAQLENSALRFGDVIDGMGLEMVGFEGEVRSSVDASLNELDDMAPAVRAELVAMEQAVSGSDFASRMYSLGFAGGTGLSLGLAAARGSVVSASAGLASGALVAVEGGFQVESPSKEFMRIGHMVGKGLQIGIEDSKGGVVEAINSIAGFRPPTAPFAAAGAPAAPPPGSTSTSSGGLNIPISVTAPRPETAARRVVSEVSDVLYLNTGRSMS